MDYTALLTVTTPILLALIGGFFTLRAGRQKASADAQSSLISGFQMLAGKLQEERVELTKVIDKQAAENVSLKAEVSTLTSTVRRLEKKFDSALRSWRRGEPPPPEEEEPESNRP